MKNTPYAFLSLAMFAAFYSANNSANNQSLHLQCVLGTPQLQGEPVAGDVNNLPVYIEANEANVQNESFAIYQGDVDIKQGNRHLQAPAEVEIKQTGEGDSAQRYAFVRGAFDYSDEQIVLDGNDAKVHLNSKDSEVYDSNYQFVGRQGRGTAESSAIKENSRTFKNATFTTCLPNDDSWQVDADEMTQHVKEEYAEMWHARFKVAGVPVFYMPYMQFPIGDRRRSGLLIPSAGSSSRDGYWYAQPVYWNIAPNYDLTFTPKYMTDRGWQLINEARYLNLLGQGTFAVEYMNNDRYEDYLDQNRSRHLLRWINSSGFGNWRFDVDYTRVSDTAYFSDFDSAYGSSTDGYATQTARVAYYQPNWNVALSAKQFQIFDDIAIGPYRTLPQLDFNYFKNGLVNGWADFKLYAQAVRFDNESKSMPTATRYHIEPSINIPLSNQYGSLNLETKLYATHYQQSAGMGVDADIERSVNRVMPQIKVDLQSVLASNESFIDGYTQTIEPHIQYLYRPYRDQGSIGSKQNAEYLGVGYDSALLQQDYYSLFRDRRYSGLDRITSANQVTLGGTTRFYDKNTNERFNLSLGQIVYLNDSRIDSYSENSTTGRTSSWAMETNWKLSNQWNWRASYQYDTRLNHTALANSALEFNPTGDNLIQLSYRYASKEYINQNLTSSVNSYNQNIEQIGSTVAWELGDQWAVVGRYYHDIGLNKAVEQYIGLQYNTCCWSAGVGVRRYLVSESSSRTYSDEKDVLYNNSVNLTFQLKGFGQNDHYSGLVDMLDKGMLPYIKPFNL